MLGALQDFVENDCLPEILRVGQQAGDGVGGRTGSHDDGSFGDRSRDPGWPGPL